MIDIVNEYIIEIIESIITDTKHKIESDDNECIICSCVLINKICECKLCHMQFHNICLQSCAETDKNTKRDIYKLSIKEYNNTVQLIHLDNNKLLPNTTYYIKCPHCRKSNTLWFKTDLNIKYINEPAKILIEQELDEIINIQHILIGDSIGFYAVSTINKMVIFIINNRKHIIVIYILYLILCVYTIFDSDNIINNNINAVYLKCLINIGLILLSLFHIFAEIIRKEAIVIENAIINGYT